MPLINVNVPSLLAGVSQQSPYIRREDQVEEAINAFPSVVDGLTKRPHTDYRSQILSGTGAAFDAYVHTIDRGDGLLFHLVVTNTGVLAYDSTGSSINVVNEIGNYNYLTGSTPRSDFKVITVQDYTFINNRDRTPSMSGLTTAGPLYGTEGFIFAKQANYKTDYALKAKLAGTTPVSFKVTTWDGNAVQPGELPTLSTAGIITGLITSGVQFWTGQGSGTWFSYDSFGSVGHFYRVPGDLDYVQATDGVSDTVLSTIYNSVLTDNTETNAERTRQLPKICRNGFKLSVVGEPANDADNYYIEFTGQALTGLSQGYWKETIAYNTPYRIDNRSMPHQLVLEPTGSTYQFRYKAVTWDDRTVGDINSNPDPSFIGRPISDIFFFQDRLGIVAQDRLLLSEQGQYFNFFRSTLRSLPDSERIDVQVSHNRVVNINHVVPYNKSLILFSDLGQFLVPGNTALNATTIAAISVSEYETSRLVRPAMAGRSIYMSYDNGNYAGIREFYQTTSEDTFDAIEITHGIPKYVKGNIINMVVNTLENVLAVLADEDRQYIYLYKYVWNGNQKVLSSWGKWQFGNSANVKVYHMSWSNSDLNILLKREDGIYLERLTLAPGYTDTGSEFVTLLDRRLDETGVSISYNQANNQTTIALPYQTSSNNEYRVISKAGLRYEVKSNSGHQVVVRGNLTGVEFWVGETYTMRVTLTPPLVKYKTDSGQSPTGPSAQKARRCVLNFKESRYLRGEVRISNRTTYTYHFTGPALGDPLAVLGTVPLSDGELVMPIMGSTDLVHIDIVNDSPFPSNLIGMNYMIEYKSRTNTRWQG